MLSVLLALGVLTLLVVVPAVELEVLLPDEALLEALKLRLKSAV
jgi:hypothetical protein